MGREPLSQWSTTDHSGPIIISTVLALVYWLVPAVGQQAVILGQRNNLSWASVFYALSMLAGFTQSVVLLVAISRGFGKSTAILDGDEAAASLQLYHTSNILYVVVLGLAKCSATCSVVSLTVPRGGSIRSASTRNKTLYLAVTALAFMWMVGSVVTLGLQCVRASPQKLAEAGCNGSIKTWTGILASDGVTDLVVAAFAASVILPTNARSRLKLIWYMPFLIRLCVIILSVVKLISFHPSTLQDDPTKAMWLFAVLTQIHIFLSLIAAGFPALKQTISDLGTNFGVSEQSQDRSRRGRSYALTSLTRRNKRQGQQDSALHRPYDGRLQGKSFVTTGASKVSSDDGSQRGIMQRHEFEITVTNDHRSEEDLS